MTATPTGANIDTSKDVLIKAPRTAFILRVSNLNIDDYSPDIFTLD